MEKLLDIAETTSILFPQKEWGVEGVVDAIGGTLCASHMVGDRIRAYFGRRRYLGVAEVIEKIAREGVSAEIQTGRNLENGLACGNRRNAVKYRGEVLRKVVTDVALDKAIMFPVGPAKEIVGLRNHRLVWWIRSCESSRLKPPGWGDSTGRKGYMGTWSD